MGARRFDRAGRADVLALLVALAGAALIGAGHLLARAATVIDDTRPDLPSTDD